MDKIRAIVKQESERRMVGFRQQMAQVTQQRDSLQQQLNRTNAELEGMKTVHNMRNSSSGSGGTTTTNNNNNDNNELTARLREQLEDSSPTRVWQYILPGMEWRKVTKGKEQLLSLYQKECETKK